MEINLRVSEIFCTFAENFKEMDQKFSIIQALCRVAVNYDRTVALHQVQRLMEAYEREGCEKEVASLKSILDYAQSHQTLSPTQITVSSVVAGEKLTKNISIPVDKETAAPILEVIFPEDLPDTPPVFDDEIREAVSSIILEWHNYEALQEMNASPSRSCLIYGLPGTGKTHLAKWMARQVGLPVVLAKLDGIVSSFLGTSSRNIGNLFTFANRYQCVLLLDEFDAIAKLRNDPQEVGEVKRIVNTLLQCLDERDNIGFTIGITNHEQLLDPAIWRRFDVQIEIPKPSQQIIPELIRRFLEPMEVSEPDIQFLSWCMQGASGADLQKLANWLKRMRILKEYQDDNLITLMRRYAVLNTERISEPVKEALEGGYERIYAALQESGVDLRKKDIAAVFSMTPSSLSKHISKLNNRKE